MLAEAVLPADVSTDWLLPEGWQAASRAAMAVRTGNLFMAAAFLLNGKDGWIITVALGRCRLLFVWDSPNIIAPFYDIKQPSRASDDPR
ncbi:hypothetical protein HpSP79_01940 [Helicobacter pylori]